MMDWQTFIFLRIWREKKLLLAALSSSFLSIPLSLSLLPLPLNGAVHLQFLTVHYVMAHIYLFVRMHACMHTSLHTICVDKYVRYPNRTTTTTKHRIIHAQLNICLLSIHVCDVRSSTCTGCCYCFPHFRSRELVVWGSFECK